MQRMTRRPGLAQARKLAGFNQEAFAEELGVTKHTVSQWETGATGINAKRRPAIAAVLGISLAELDRLIRGEPLSSLADFPPPDRIVLETPNGRENWWLIDAARLPRRSPARTTPRNRRPPPPASSSAPIRDRADCPGRVASWSGSCPPSASPPARSPERAPRQVSSRRRRPGWSDVFARPVARPGLATSRQGDLRSRRT